MARPVDTKKREALAQQAFEHIKAQGFERVTMSSLARALEMKRSTLYWYFNDIHAIFEVVLESLLTTQDAFILERMQQQAHPLDLAMEYIRAVHGFYAQRADVIVLLFQFWALAGTSPQRALEQLKAHHLPRRQLAVAALESGIDSGHIAPCDVDVVVSTLSAMVDGLLVQLVVEPSIDMAARHTLIFDAILEPLRRDPSLR